MIALKTMIAVSALASASAVSALSSLPHGDDQPVSFSERFPSVNQVLVPPVTASDDSIAMSVTIPRGNRLGALDRFCAGQQWPYIAPECLVAGKGSTVRLPSRVVTVDRATLAQR